MAANRKRRFGTIRKLPSGRWQARYRGPDGLLRSAPHTFPRQRDADQWLAVVESELLRGEWIDPWLSEMTLGEFGRRWIKDRTLKPRTRDDYEGMFRNYIGPDLGTLAVGEIGTATVRQWRTKLLDGGVSGNRAAKVYRLLRAILYTAVDDGMISGIRAGSRAPTRRPSTPAQSQPWARSTPSRTQCPAGSGHSYCSAPSRACDGARR
jgi:hypothetical protein